MTKVAATPLEPTPATLANPVRRYLLATRPAFLTIALAGCLLGFATALDAAFSWPLALLTVLLAVATQAGVYVFNHWFYRTTIARVVIDLMFPVLCVILAAIWIGRGGQLALEKVAFYAVIFALATIVFSAWLGIYQRVHSRTRTETRARAVLSLYLAIPLAYAVFALLSVAEVDRGYLLLSGLAALFATLVHRVHSAHSRTGLLLSHRVLVFGAGEEAENVGRVLRKSDPEIQIQNGRWVAVTDYLAQ